MITTPEILERLKCVREAAELSQNEVASELRLNRTTYARKEKGDIPITTDEWLALSKILKKDLLFFFLNNLSVRSGVFPPPEREERTLLTLYRSLDAEEKRDLIHSIRLLLKRVNRKKVRQSLDSLGESLGDSPGQPEAAGK